MWWRRKAAAPKHRGRRRIDEASNSFAVFIVMAPVVFGAFGMGLDISRNTYIKTSLQNDLDLAVVGGAAETQIKKDNGAVIIKYPDAINTVEKVYAINRDNGPVVRCWGNQGAIPGTDLKRCWRVVSTKENPRYLQYTVREQSKNAFLPVIGITYQRYTLTGEARVAQDTR